MAHAEKIPPVYNMEEVSTALTLSRLPRQCAKAILWAAGNDCPAVCDAETISGFVSVALIASVWELKDAGVTDLIHRIRTGKASAVSALDGAIAKARNRRAS